LLCSCVERLERQSHGPAVDETPLTPEPAMVPGMHVGTDQHAFPGAHIGVVNRLSTLAVVGGGARHQVDVSLRYDEEGAC